MSDRPYWVDHMAPGGVGIQDAREMYQRLEQCAAALEKAVWENQDLRAELAALREPERVLGEPKRDVGADQVEHHKCPECGDTMAPYDTTYKVGGWRGWICPCGNEVYESFEPESVVSPDPQIEPTELDDLRRRVAQQRIVLAQNAVEIREQKKALAKADRANVHLKMKITELESPAPASLDDRVEKLDQ